MDRLFVYPGSIPQDTDELNTNRNTMIALHGLLQAAIGTTSTLSGNPLAGTAVDGFAVTPTLPNSLQVVLGPGTITQLLSVDATPYGSLPADLNDACYKMGIALAPQTFTFTAPIGVGTSQSSLIEVAFSETDTGLTVLPYYNSANPALPYSGPGNSGASQATVRKQAVTAQIKYGVAAATGAQMAPSPDLGYVAVAVVTVAYGQTAITSANIATPPLSRFVPWKLPELTPGFAFSQVFTSFGLFTVPPQITRLRATVTGGGGGGGGSNAANTSGGGGGAGATTTVWIYNVYPGSTLPASVGAGGAGGSAGAAGGAGGTSSFGIYASVTGGSGGGAGTSGGSGLGGASGGVTTGTNNQPGGNGTNGIPGISCGGQGGGPGGGNGGNSGANGTAAPGFGGGGGGASGSGFTGGAGGAGKIVIEW